MDTKNKKKVELSLDQRMQNVKTCIARGNQTKLNAAIDALGQSVELNHVTARMAYDIGILLAKKGYENATSILAERGWATKLFPPDDKFVNPIGDFLRHGSSFEFIDSLATHGVDLFSHFKHEGHSASPLVSCAQRGDTAGCLYLLGRLAQSKNPTPRIATERMAFVIHSLENPKGKCASLARRLMSEDPNIWGKASTESKFNLLQKLLDKGEWAIFELLAKQFPELLAKVSAQETMLGKHPLKALKILDSLNFSFATPEKSKNSALHTASSLVKNSQAICSFLLAKGLDPRQANEFSETPIGIATATWSLAQLQKIFSATADDLSMSFHRAHDLATLTGSIVKNLDANAATIDDFKEPAPNTDRRMACIIAKAMESKRFADFNDPVKGFMESANRGFPSSMKLWHECARRIGLAPDAGWLSTIFTSMPMSNDRELGRISCLDAAKNIGINLDATYKIKTSRGFFIEKSLLVNAMTTIAKHHGNTNVLDAATAKAIRLVQLGANPHKAIALSIQDLTTETEALYAPLMAMHEANLLRESLGAKLQNLPAKKPSL